MQIIGVYLALITIVASQGVINITGIWRQNVGSDQSKIVQSGSTVTATNPVQSWSPAKGTISGNTVFMFGLKGLINNDVITWSNQAVWTKTGSMVQFVISSGNLSSQFNGFEFLPAKCFDGDINTFCHSATGNSWLQLDLGTAKSVGKVVIYNRIQCCQDRLGTHSIWVGLTAGNPQGSGNVLCWKGTAPSTNGPFEELCSGNGRYVYVFQTASSEYLNLAEVQVHGFEGDAKQTTPTPSYYYYYDNDYDYYLQDHQGYGIGGMVFGLVIFCAIATSSVIGCFCCFNGCCSGRLRSAERKYQKQTDCVPPTAARQTEFGWNRNAEFCDEYVFIQPIVLPHLPSAPVLSVVPLPTPTCSNCLAVVAVDNAFCVQCGTQVQPPGQNNCSNCHNQLAPDLAFCVKCGTAAPVPVPAASFEHSLSVPSVSLPGVYTTAPPPTYSTLMEMTQNAMAGAASAPPLNDAPPPYNEIAAYISDPSLKGEGFTMYADPPSERKRAVAGNGCWASFQHNPHIFATIISIACIGIWLFMFFCFSDLTYLAESSYECWQIEQNNTLWVVAPILTFIYYIACFCAPTMRYLAHASNESGGIMMDKVGALRSATPVLSWYIECWHNETRTTGSGKNRRSHTVRVVTHRANHNYNFKWWCDVSDDSYLSWTNLLLIKMTMTKSYVFADLDTRLHHGDRKAAFINANKFDAHQSFTETLNINGFHSKSLLQAFPGAKPKGLTWGYYILASLFFMSVPYRWWFSAISQNRSMNIVKQIKRI